MRVQELKSSWSDLPADHPMAGIERRRVMGGKMMVSHVLLDEGFEVAAHQHENEQITIVLEGRLRFHLGEREDALQELDVAAGEVLLLPPWLWHRARALERSLVLDLFSPPSERTGVDAAGAHAG